MKSFIILFSFFLAACSASTDSEDNFFVKTFQKFSPGQKETEARSESLTAGDYVRWIENEENGLRVKRAMGDFSFTLQYKPLDYVALSHFKKKNIERKIFNKKKEEFEGMQYYTLRIQSQASENLLKAGIKNPQEEFARLEYFAFRMQEDLELIDGKDTLPCVLHHFERTYNIAPYSDFVLGFDLGKGNKDKVNSNDKVLIYHDRALNLGIIKIKIRKEDLRNTPTLIYNNNTHESKS